MQTPNLPIQLLAQWHPKNDCDPYTISAGSHKKVFWICDLGHEWKAVIYNRALAGSGCPICSKRFGSNHTNWKGFEEIPMTFWNSIQWNAKTRKLEFAITIEFAWKLFIQQQRKCALTAWPISMNAKTRTASLDRISSDLGYVEENVQWVHKDVNFAKMNLSESKFLLMCRAVSDKMGILNDVSAL